MAVTSTTRFGLTSWSSGDDPLGRAQFQSDNLAVEALGAIWRTGTNTERPAASTASAARSFYYSTTDSVLYYSDGTNWRSVGAYGNSGDAYTLVAGTVTTPQGTADRAARADHKHAVSTASAGTVSGANAEGTATTLARSDHDHALAANTVGNTQLAANSVTKAKIDATAIVKPTTGMLSFDTTNGLSVNINSAFLETVSNAISVKANSITPTELSGNIGKAKLATDIVKATGAILFDTTNGLSVNTSATIGISGNALVVNTNSIGPSHLTTGVVGVNSGLTGGNNTALSIVLDGTATGGLEVNANALRIKAGGVTSTMLAGNIGKALLSTDIVSGSGAISFSTSTGLAVLVDNTTIAVTANALGVKNNSIGPSQVASTIFQRGTYSGITASSAKIHVYPSSTATNTISGTAGDILVQYTNTLA